MKYLHIKKELDTIQFDAPLGSILSQEVANVILGRKRSLWKICFELFFLEKRHKPIRTGKNLITFFHDERKDLRSLFQKYRQMLKVTGVYIHGKSLDARSIRPNVKWHFRATKQALSVFQKHVKLGFAERAVLAVAINYKLKKMTHIKKALAQFTGKKYYCFNSTCNDEMIFASLLRKRCTVISFQHAANVYLGKKFESNFQHVLNINCDLLYVWGDVYKKLFEKHVPGVSVKIIGNPRFLNKKIKITSLKEPLVICLDGPENLALNKKIIDVAKKTGKKYVLRKHPFDTNTYSKNVNENFCGFSDTAKNSICIIHNSSVFFELLLHNACCVLDVGTNDMQLLQEYPLRITSRDLSKINDIKLENIKTLNAKVLEDHFSIPRMAP